MELEEIPEPLVRVRDQSRLRAWQDVQALAPWERLGTYNEIACSGQAPPGTPAYVAELLALRAYADLLRRHEAPLTAEAIFALEQAAASNAYPKSWRYILQLRLAQMTRYGIGAAESVEQFETALKWCAAFGHPLDLAAGQMVYGASLAGRYPEQAGDLLKAARETMRDMQTRISSLRLQIEEHVQLMHLWHATIAEAEGRRAKAAWHRSFIGHVRDDMHPFYIKEPLRHPSFYQTTFFDW